MDVFQHFAQEINRVYVLGLNILPDAVLMSGVAALGMEKLQQFIASISAKLFEQFMSSERPEILDDAADRASLWLDNRMQMGRHQHESKKH